MALNGTDSSNGYIEATKTNGYAISKPIVQENGPNVSETASSEIIGGNEDLITNSDPFGDGSCIILWTLDGDTSDSNGNYNGTWSGNEQYDTGKFGQGAKFDGSSEITSDVISNLAQFPITQSVWISTTDNNKGFLEFKYSGGNYHHLGFYVNNNNLNYYYYDGSQHFIDTGKLINDGSFYHCIAVIEDNPKRIKIFINSELVHTIVYTGTLNGDFDQITVGQTLSQGKINGIVDQVRIFNKALTQEEIQHVYQESSQFIYKDEFATTTSISIGDEVSIRLDDGSYNDWVVNNVNHEILSDKIDTFNDGSSRFKYGFDGNVNDLTGNFNGTWVGNEQYDIGKIGQGAKFDGSSYVKTGAGGISLPFSISFWMKSVQNDCDGDYWSHNCIIGHACNSAPDNDFGIETCNKDLHIFCGFGSEENKTFTGTNVCDGNWHHVVVVWDSTEARVYVDTEYVDKMTYAGSQNICTDELTIGVMSSGTDVQGGSYYEGLLDQLDMYTKVLTENEIKLLYLNDVYMVDTTTITNGDAPSKVYFKSNMETDFSSIKNIVGKYELANISNGSTEDTLVTAEPIANESNIVIVKDDDSIHEIDGSRFIGFNMLNNVDPFGDSSGIALWKLDGNTNDSGGNYNGTWHGTESYDAGKFGQAAKFDGNNYIEAPDLSNIVNLQAQEFSVSFWFSTTQTSDGVVFSIFDNDGGVINCGAGGVDFANDTSGDFLDWNNNFSYSDGQWHNFIAVVTNNSKLTIYVDGSYITEITSKTNLGFDGTIKNTTRIGRQSDSYPHALIGNADQIRVFNRALTQEEVSLLYKEIEYRLDTTSITQGEIPSRAYKVDESLEFNNKKSSQNSRSYTLSQDILKADIVFSEVDLDHAREVKTKVNMSSKGNKMTELKFDLWKN